MFIGHFGFGMGLKRSAPAVSLGTLFLGAQFIDLLWPVFLLTGTEHASIDPAASGPPITFTDYPISHSLAMVAVWSLLVGGAYYGFRRSARGAVVCAVAVMSHWWLDLIVHVPDLPLAPGMPQRLGLGLWQSLPATIVVECAIFAVGCLLYCRVTRPADRIGSIGFWALVASLIAIYIGNLFGPPPPNIEAIAWVGQAQWLFVAWGYWVDAHRGKRVAAAPA